MFVIHFLVEWKSICYEYGTVGLHQDDGIGFLAIDLMLKCQKNSSVKY